MDVLNEIELQSWQAALEADGAHDGIWNYCYDEEHPWGNIGCGGVDFYWTTSDDGSRRCEYWSTDPGDNDYGVLIFVDGSKMVAIGEGSDDGLCLFGECEEEFSEEELVKQLFVEGWPRFEHEGDDSEESEEEDAE